MNKIHGTYLLDLEDQPDLVGRPGMVCMEEESKLRKATAVAYLAYRAYLEHLVYQVYPVCLMALVDLAVLVDSNLQNGYGSHDVPVGV